MSHMPDPSKETREVSGPDADRVHRYDQAWMHDFMRVTFDRCLAISKAKSNDYAGEDHPFKNFALVADLGLCPTEVGIVVRIGDKISRLSTLIRRPDQRSVVDETIQDTIDDAINYLAILGAYLTAQKRAGQPQGVVIPSSRCHGFIVTEFGKAMMNDMFVEHTDPQESKEDNSDADV